MLNARTCLWFDNNALAAATFYTEVFGDVEILNVAHTDFAFPDNAGEKTDQGTVLTVDFRIGQQRFIGLNGGPMFPLSECVSIQIDCADQAEVDRYWDAIVGQGGQESQCGWCKDRFGLSWQIVPTRLAELLGDPDPGRAQRAAQAMMTMQRIDVAALEAAADAQDS